MSELGHPEVAALGPVGMVSLRADLAAPEVSAALVAATGCALPPPRRIAFAGDRALAWMSPDEVMLFGPYGQALAEAAALSGRLGPLHHLSVDVSDARARFRISGPGARDLLAKGAPVDFAPSAFGPGDLRRTRLGQVAVAFWMRDDLSFELMCFRSVAGFVADWLANAVSGGRPGYFAE